MKHANPVPGISPWTRIVPTRTGCVRVICRDRRMVDLGPQESAHVVAYCRRGGRPSPAATKGYRILAQLGQLESCSPRRREATRARRGHRAGNRPAGGVPSGARPDAATAQVLLLAPPTWHAGLRSTLALVGVEVVVLPAHPTTVDLDLAIPRCTAAVLVGELDWGIAGRLQRSHIPHLLLTPGERSANASSWVVPGQRPCLRCQYLCQRDADPLWREVLAQLHNWPTPDPDPLLVHGCGLYVANVLRTHLSASASSTPPVASGQVRLAVTGAITNTRNSTFHPACGCARGVANEKTRVAA